MGTIIVFFILGTLLYAAPDIFRMGQGSKAERDMKKMHAKHQVEMQKIYGDAELAAKKRALEDLRRRIG